MEMITLTQTFIMYIDVLATVQGYAAPGARFIINRFKINRIFF